MRNFLFFISLFFLICLPTHAVVSNTVSLKFKAEGGALKSHLESNYISNGEFQINLSKTFSDFSVRGWGKIRPEIWDTSDMSSALKFFSGISFFSSRKQLRFGGQFTFNSAAYYNLNYDYSYQLSRFNGFILGHFLNNISWILNAGYFYRDFSSIIPFETDGINFQLKLEKHFPNKVKFMLQLYGTKFTVKPKNLYFYSPAADKNSGTQLGPEAGLKIGQRSIFTMSYGLYLHQSDIIPSTEFLHKFTMAYIRKIGPTLHFMLHANLTDFNAKLRNADSRWLLFYSNQKQNRFYVKIEKDLSPTTAAFIRAGYTREELIWNTLELSGTQIVVGIQIKP